MSAYTEPTGPDRDGPGKLSRTDTWILEALRARGAQTIEQLESSICEVSRAQVFLAIDRMSRSGLISLCLTGGEYRVSMKLKEQVLCGRSSGEELL